jgi:hypothetical protein
MDATGPFSILSAMSERDRRVAIGYPREPEDVPRLIGAVRAALGHHEPQETANGIRVCPKCSRAAGSMVRAPCPEVAAITRELTGEGNDRG